MNSEYYVVVVLAEGPSGPYCVRGVLDDDWMDFPDFISVQNVRRLPFEAFDAAPFGRSAAGPTIREVWISRARVVEVVWCTDQANALYTAEDAQ